MFKFYIWINESNGFCRTGQKIRVKVNFKPWFDPEAIPAIQNEANYIQDSEIQAQKQTKKNHNLKNISSKGATQT